MKRLAGVAFVAVAIAGIVPCCSSGITDGADACQNADTTGPCDGTFPCSNGGISVTCPKSAVCAIGPGSVTCLPGPAGSCVSPKQASTACTGGTPKCSGSASTGVTVTCSAGSVGSISPGGGGGGGATPGSVVVDQAACTASQAQVEKVAESPDFLQGPVAVTADSIVLMTNSSYTIVPKAAGGTVKTLFTPPTALLGGSRSFIVAPNGKGYVLSQKLDGGEALVITEVALPSGPPTTVAMLGGFIGAASFVDAVGDDVFIVIDTEISTDGGTPGWSLLAFSTSAKTVRTVGTLGITSPDGPVTYRGTKDHIAWYLSSTGAFAIDPATANTKAVTPAIDFKTYPLSQISAFDQGLFGYDTNNNWYSFDDELKAATPVNRDPTNATTFQWRGLVAATADALYALQTQSPGNGASKLKRVPRDGSAPTVVACELNSLVVLDDAYAYFAVFPTTLSRRALK